MTTNDETREEYDFFGAVKNPYADSDTISSDKKEDKPMPESIQEKIERFYSPLRNYQEGAPNTRYKSWEWCHAAFLTKKEEYKNATDAQKEEIIDYLSLHLAFYLASWGMYRGSTYLLKRDYKAHKKAVKTILELEDKYDLLWDYTPDESNIEKANVLLFDATTGIYWKIKRSYKGYDSENESEDAEEDKSAKGDESSYTLTTKILMGTFGCIPAFDRFLKSGIKCYIANHNDQPNKKVRSIKIGKYKLTQSIESNKKEEAVATESFMALAALVSQHKDDFKIPDAPMYPPMKCVDMYLWEVGFEMDIAANLVGQDTSENQREKWYNNAVDLQYCDAGVSYAEASRQIIELNQ